MRCLRVLCVLCGLVFPAAALDREAFTFTKYDLEVRVEPEQQRLGVRGKITLRNDSESAQKNLVLQISSTLNWSSIQLDGQPVEFASQIYNSDIDHTGALAEAIVTLPRPLGPKQVVELEIGYEGIIPQDATRLTRIGTPADVAKHSDWDQIGKSFSGVRGIGYVAWYPIAAEAASLSEGNSVIETVGRWKQRESRAEIMKVDFIQYYASGVPTILFCNGRGGARPGFVQITGGMSYLYQTKCWFDSLATTVPLFLISNFEGLDKPAVNISFLPGHKSGAENYVLAVEQTEPFVTKWFGDHREKEGPKSEVVDLPDSDAAPFESGNLRLMPLTGEDTTLLLAAIQQLTHATFPSSRPWIYDGLARYAQLAFLQEEEGRSAVVEYLLNHRGALSESEKQNIAQGNNKAAERSLINAADEFFVQAKAMGVWWMLRDMVGETALTAALHDYNSSNDKDASYMQKLIEAQAHRDLQWFFDDWVYRDRGLPDLRIDSVYPRQLPTGGYMVTVTVENLGDAGAEVPVILQMENGEATQKLVVPGKSKAAVRIPAATLPQQVTVNDGSVHESNISNNIYKTQSVPNTP
jgi:hypothetical protein